MKICKTCKWWHKEPCTKDWGHCTKTVVDEGKPVCPDSKAQAWDVEGFYTVLQTKEDFGCVQWEALKNAYLQAIRKGGDASSAK